MTIESTSLPVGYSEDYMPYDTALSILVRLDSVSPAGAVDGIFRLLLDASGDIHGIVESFAEKNPEAMSNFGASGYFALLAISRCVEVVRQIESENYGLIRATLDDGLFWSGCAVGVSSVDESAATHIQGLMKKARSELATKGANAAHAKNHVNKAMAIEFYRNNRNRFTSKERAAEYISEHVVSNAFRTVRGWLTEA